MEISYYDRTTDRVLIGVFKKVEDNQINSGQLFIVPRPVNQTRQHNGLAGCCEGRANSLGYGLPILLRCKGSNRTHIMSVGYGSWIRDICFILCEDE